MTDVAIDPARIRDRAHALWLERGCAAGCAERDWLDAERALIAEEAARRGSPAAVAMREPPVVAAAPANRALNGARPRLSTSAAVPPAAAPAGKGTKAPPSGGAKRTG
jgi:hypothetical protein